VNSALAAHLASHHGIVTRTECIALGVSKRQLEWMIEHGDLTRVFRGVYRHAATPGTAHQRLYAGLCAVGDGAVVSHRSALALHGARNFSCDLVEVSVPSRTSVHDGLVAHRTTPLLPVELCRRHGSSSRRRRAPSWTRSP
jgi:predicted transcriptional regulator of viral defense system